LGLTKQTLPVEMKVRRTCTFFQSTVCVEEAQSLQSPADRRGRRRGRWRPLYSVQASGEVSRRRIIGWTTGAGLRCWPRALRLAMQHLRDGVDVVGMARIDIQRLVFAGAWERAAASAYCCRLGAGTAGCFAAHDGCCSCTRTSKRSRTWHAPVGRVSNCMAKACLLQLGQLVGC
jgi:hypothetical protein